MSELQTVVKGQLLHIFKKTFGKRIKLEKTFIFLSALKDHYVIETSMYYFRNEDLEDIKKALTGWKISRWSFQANDEIRIKDPSFTVSFYVTPISR
jgi:hypothetical protein